MAKRGAPRRDARTRPSQSKQPRGRTVIHVTSEGKTERDYLRHLQTTYGTEMRFQFAYHPAKGTDATSVVARAIEIQSELRGEERNQVWALFDDDGKPDVDVAVARAERAGINLAFSHPSFELWLWLHFAPGLPGSQGGDNGWLISQLRTIPAFRVYGKDGGGQGCDKNLSPARCDALKDEAQAVRLARELVKRCPSGCCDPADDPPHGARCNAHGRDPSTSVYRLLETLRIV